MELNQRRILLMEQEEAEFVIECKIHQKYGFPTFILRS